MTIKGELKLSSSGYKFAHQVCPGFPVKIGSDSLEKSDLGIPNSCSVTFKGKKIYLLDDTESFKSVLGVFKTPNLKPTYGSKSDQELLEIYYDLPAETPRYFYFTPAHFEEFSIYLLRGMERSGSRAKGFEKYTRGKDLIYVWGTPFEGDPDHKKVSLITKDYQLTCLGSACLEYLGEIRDND